MKTLLISSLALFAICLTSCGATGSLGPNTPNRDPVTGRYFTPNCPNHDVEPSIVGAVYVCPQGDVYHSLPEVGFPSIPGFSSRLVSAPADRPPVKVTIHNDPSGSRTYTLDDAGPRIPHKARRHIANVGNGDDANFLESLWNRNRQQ